MYPVTIELDHATYRGTYAIRHRLITVSYNGDDDTRYLEDLSPEILARRMLFTLIPKAHRPIG